MNIKLPEILTQTCPKNMKLPKILMQYCPNDIKLPKFRHFKTKRGWGGGGAVPPGPPLLHHCLQVLENVLFSARGLHYFLIA